MGGKLIRIGKTVATTFLFHSEHFRSIAHQTGTCAWTQLNLLVS